MLYAGHQPTSEIGQNSWWQPLVGAGERDSRSYCPDTRGQRRAPKGPGSFPRWLADSTCPVRHPSGVRARTRDASRHRVASSIPFSYSLRSLLVARRALMIRIRPSRRACATNRIRRQQMVPPLEGDQAKPESMSTLRGPVRSRAVRNRQRSSRQADRSLQRSQADGMPCSRHRSGA